MNSVPWSTVIDRGAAPVAIARSRATLTVLVVGSGSSNFDLTLPAAASDPGTLQQCLQACSQGITAIENFCRSLPPFPPYMRAIKALCWGSRWSLPLCEGFCYSFWGA
jgi:hypothetical protein